MHLLLLDPSWFGAVHQKRRHITRQAVQAADLSAFLTLHQLQNDAQEECCATLQMSNASLLSLGQHCICEPKGWVSHHRELTFKDPNQNSESERPHLSKGGHVLPGPNGRRICAARVDERQRLNLSPGSLSRPAACTNSTGFQHRVIGWCRQAVLGKQQGC